MSIPTVIQRRLELQGFVCINDPAFIAVVPWLRFTPAVGMIMIGIGTALASPFLLWALVPFAAFGTITGVHPVDFVYNYGIRYLTGTPPLPKNPVPRRFGFGLMAVALIIDGWLFWVSALIAGYLFGVLLTIIPAINVTISHFCILSLIYQTLFGRWVSPTNGSASMNSVEMKRSS